MSSLSSHRFRLSSNKHPINSVKSVLADHHATVNCLECNRIMVPRVVTYYGQPLRSVCPFCGATFAKFPSGLQRFFEHFQPKAPSLDAFKSLVMLTLCFGLIWLISDWVKVPEEFSFVGTIGTLILAIIAAAELTVQFVEFIAAKLSHESNYYWAGLVLTSLVLSNENSNLINYLILFLGIMILRWFVVGFLQILRTKGQ
ncbi:hypothetical protein QZJ86_19840 [Methylomonas montana]|uniref:hypothetical protein n=1 Tax=Methylomonas montana TaxID=3058963 RepID=UPI0026594985|nr:hypothetical protein [Methylomonas montana]WKJ90238.1 hypothetical protein QZJ86_19840 [Methylomonas montana]